MKKAVSLSPCLAVLLIACASQPVDTQVEPDISVYERQDRAPQGPVVSGRVQDPRLLLPNELLSVSLPGSTGTKIRLSPAGEVHGLMSFLSECKAHSYFTDDEKYALALALFRGLPADAPVGIVRQVYSGAYFKDGGPLEIRIAAFEPNQNMPLGTKKLLVLTTNIVLDEESEGAEHSRESGRVVGLDGNATIIFFALADGRIVSMFDLRDGADDEAFAASRHDPLVGLMRAQAMLADQHPDNDRLAVDILAPIAADESKEPGIRLMARLKLYQAAIARNDVAVAREEWTEVLLLAPEVPGDATPEALEAMNGAELRLYERLAAS